MTGEGVRGEVRALVRGLLRRHGVVEDVGDADPLLTSGLLESVDVLEVVTLLESRFGVDFAIRAFDPGDFDTVDGIVAVVEESGSP